MVEMAAEQGMTLTTEEVRGFLRQMDDEDEFDDIEIEPVAHAAIAGGGHSTSNSDQSNAKKIMVTDVVKNIVRHAKAR